jgi:hypothetical protein
LIRSNVTAGLLDRTLILNQRHLLHALREFAGFYHAAPSGHRERSPAEALPAPIADPDQIACLEVRRRDRLGGILHEYRHAA